MATPAAKPQPSVGVGPDGAVRRVRAEDVWQRRRFFDGSDWRWRFAEELARCPSHSEADWADPQTLAAAEFLRNMTTLEVPVVAPTVAPQPHPVTQDASAKPAKPAKPPAISSRANLKHIGGYFDDEIVEKVAVLRARLKLDNSELIKLAIEDLYRKHNAKRAFGD